MKVVLCFSGGLDSTVLLYHIRNLDYEVLPIFVNYGQKHMTRELNAAITIEPTLELVTVKTEVMTKGSLTGSDPVPDGHYADESMKQTVVPNRNMILIAFAGAYAVSSGAAAVVIAAHAGDHTIYPDCRPKFIDAMDKALQLGTYEKVFITAPFLMKTKADIVKKGDKLGAPMGLTYSCYKGGMVHCGTCGTCYERKEAFQLAGVYDPTEYAA